MWLGSQLDQPILFAFFRSENILLDRICLLYVRNRGLLAWSFELQWSSLGILCEICGSISRLAGGHGCGFLPPRISELRVFSVSTHSMDCIVIFTKFHYFLMPGSDISVECERWTIFKIAQTSLIASTCINHKDGAPLNHAAHLVLSTLRISNSVMWPSRYGRGYCVASPWAPVSWAAQCAIIPQPFVVQGEELFFEKF